MAIHLRVKQYRLKTTLFYFLPVHFYGRAGSDQKVIGFLEPVDFQLDLLGKMNAHDQKWFFEPTPCQAP